jgi:flagellar FliJ protein
MSTFRLEPVLRLRRTLRDECTVRAAEANRAAGLAADRAAHRLVELRGASLAGGGAPTFLASVAAQGHRAEAVRLAEAALHEARTLHRTRLDELVVASTRVSALERLEARTIDAARIEERKAEQREVDDLVTSRFARRGAGR